MIDPTKAPAFFVENYSLPDAPGFPSENVTPFDPIGYVQSQVDAREQALFNGTTNDAASAGMVTAAKKDDGKLSTTATILLGLLAVALIVVGAARLLIK